MDVHDEIRMMMHPDAMVELPAGIMVRASTAFWLLWNSEAQGDRLQNMAGRILDDVVREDELAHVQETLQ